MELKSQTNLFVGGMDLDTDVSQLDSKKYREAQNIRILSDNESTRGVLQNIEDVRQYEGGISDKETILGTAVTLWYNKETDTTEQVGVVITKEQLTTIAVNNIYVVYGFETIKPIWKLIICVKQLWSDKVSVVTNYEKHDVCNLYISNAEQQIKRINLQKNYNASKEAPFTDVNQLNILPKGILCQPTLEQVINGALTGGVYQYVCQLYEKNGSNSIYSQASELIKITSSEETEGSSFKGDQNIDITNKGIKISCTVISGKCDRLRFVRVYYKSSTGTPICEVVSEINIPAKETEATYTLEDGGITALSTITPAELNTLPNIFKAETIVKFKNRLFAANLVQYQFDINYDARAYRCNKKGNVKLVGADKTIETALANILDGSIVIDEEFNCINPLNQALEYATENSDEEYAFAEGGVKRGGTGLNVSYEFVTGALLEDDAPTTTDGNLIIPGRQVALDPKPQSISQMYLINPETKTKYLQEVDNTMRQWNARSSYVCNKFTGYQRDGIYRFGIVFFNEIGQRSPVHWIGDVRFPSQAIDGYFAFESGGQFNGKNYSLVSKPLGIRFTVKNIPATVKTYAIVRATRTAADRNIVTQGLLSKTIAYSGWRAQDGSTADPTYEQTVLENDRRPPIFPSFFRRMFDQDTVYVKTSLSMPGLSMLYPLFSDSYPVAKGYLEQNGVPTTTSVAATNTMDKSGVYTFVSSDLCFNRQNMLSIVKKNMYISPVCLVDGRTNTNTAGGRYSSHGTQLDSDKYTDDIVFDDTGSSINGLTSLTPVFKEKTTSSQKAYYFVLSGRFDVSNGVIGNVCKYYVQFNKKYAADYTGIGNSRLYKETNYTALIKNVISANYLGINMIREDIKNEENGWGDVLKRLKDYGQVIDQFKFVNTPIGSDGQVGVGGPSLCIYSPDLAKKMPGNVVDSIGGTEMAAFCPLIVNIIKNTTPYGGTTYNALCNTTYGNTVALLLADESTVNCFGGDTYLNVFDYVHAYRYNAGSWNDERADNSNRAFVAYYVPLENHVNSYYRHDDHFSMTANDSDSDPLSYWGHRASTAYGLNAGDASDTGYIQQYNQYSINSSYQVEQTLFKYLPKAKDTDLVSYRIATVTASEAKTTGEQKDSFCTFKFANYVDADVDHGKITNLKVFNDKLYFFQDSAVGVLSVNERSIVTDNNSNAVQLGTGTVLQQFDYLVVNNGDSITNDRSIVASDSNLYWYDYDKNVICALGQGFSELSKAKLVQTYLNRLPDEGRKEPVAFFDKKYNEVWFRLYDRSIIYNEQLQCFTSFYTHNPNWFFPFSTKMITIKDNNCYYLHNQYAVDSTEKEERVSKIRFIVNQDPTITKAFDNQWFEAELQDKVDSTRPEIIKNVFFETKTQETEPIDYTKIENREDTYRFSINREKQKNASLQEKVNKSLAGRMRGKYLICNYTFDCNDNREFKLPYITTTYRYSLV